MYFSAGHLFVYRGLRYRIIFDWDVEGRATSGKEDTGEDELEHAYEKYRFGGGIEKPDFETVYEAVKEYIKAFLPQR